MRPLVLITYRNRQTHLNCLIPYLQKYFPQLNLCVVEQDDQHYWNKGLLYNMGYRLLAKEYDYVILSDVDFIPTATVDYSYTPQPTLLSTECSQFNYQHCYDTFFGGVVGMSNEHYELINGFSNEFRGYGGEDDNLRLSCIEKGLTPVKRIGNRFENFTHPRPDNRPGSDFFSTADYQNNLKLATSPRNFKDGLSNCMDYVESYSIDYLDFIHIKVKTK